MAEPRMCPASKNSCTMPPSSSSGSWSPRGSHSLSAASMSCSAYIGSGAPCSCARTIRESASRMMNSATSRVAPVEIIFPLKPDFAKNGMRPTWSRCAWLTNRCEQSPGA